MIPDLLQSSDGGFEIVEVGSRSGGSHWRGRFERVKRKEDATERGYVCVERREREEGDECVNDERVWCLILVDMWKCCKKLTREQKRSCVNVD